MWNIWILFANYDHVIVGTGTKPLRKVWQHLRAHVYCEKNTAKVRVTSWGGYSFCPADNVEEVQEEQSQGSESKLGEEGMMVK